MKHEIVLMAKSKKGDDGYCIAGIDADSGNWIRLNMRGNYSIPRRLFIYPDGTEPELLDSILIEFDGRDKTLVFQPENYYCNIASLCKSEKDNCNVAKERLERDSQYEEVLYDNLPYVEASMLRGYQGEYRSLMIVEPEDFHYFKQQEGKINAYFRYKGNDYKAFRITDIDFINSLKAETPGRYHYPDKQYVLVVSMGVPFINRHSGAEECWKLVAAVIEKNEILRNELLPTETPVKKAGKKVDKCIEDELYNRLKDLRFSLAQQEGLPPYCIFHNRTLKEMCEKLPENEEEMLDVFGIGEGRLTKYGEAFLSLIRDYKKEKGIASSKATDVEQLELVDILEVIENGANPITGEIFEREELIKDERFLSVIKRLYKSYVEDIEARPQRAGQIWQEDEDKKLEDEYRSGMSVEDIAKAHGRTIVAIYARLERNNLLK